MHRFFLVTIAMTIVSLGPICAQASIRKPRPKVLAASAGYTNVTFAGVNNSDFSAFHHYHVDFSFHRFPKMQWYRYGFGVNITPDLTFKNVVWSNGSKGNYLVTLQNIYLVLGGYRKQFLWGFLAGYESISWKGTPNAGASKLSYFTPGFELGWFFHQEGKFTFPAFIRYWQKPERKLTFETYPNDPLSARSGHAIEVDIGVHYGF